MRFRLEMPHVDRSIFGGTIVRWHKKEGEWVDYGDAVFDFRTEGVRTVGRSQRAHVLTNLTSAAVQERSVVHVASAVRHVDVEVRSSDAGFLRRIEATEGAYHETGDRLAVLTTTADEPLIDGDDSTEGATFRVIANKVVE